MATTAESTTWTLQQARAMIARQLIADYDRAGIIDRLRLLDPDRKIPASATDMSLAYRLAWRLLPAGAGVMSNENADRVPNAVLDGTDSGTVGVQPCE